MKLLSLFMIIAISAGNFQSKATGVLPVKLYKVAETVKVYPTPDNAGSITIFSVNKCKLHFYLFDLEGKLIYQSTLTKNNKQTVNGLTKGTYSYNAFQNDESIKGGQVILR